MKVYENLVLDEERALYGIKDALVRKCTFAGEADGESALKETDSLEVRDCDFRLRYPMWHMKNSKVENCKMSDTCRAALWYCENICIENSILGGIKAVRECSGVNMANCQIESTEFGWFCRGLNMYGGIITSEYTFLKTASLNLENIALEGKYSFQYVENAVIKNCVLSTKDAFWHSKNVTVYDSIVNGEYLGWYSENLTFIRCKIKGTQPLCYAENLTLTDCEMTDCDLSFEKSSVRAGIVGEITSVKNPKSGRISAGHIGEIILDGPTECGIVTTEK